MNGASTYPEDWADCNCPPPDSMDADGEFYRAVKNTPPTAADLLSAIEANKFHNAGKCDRLAISLLRTWQGAVHHLELYPWKAGWQIATLRLLPEHGKVKDTPSNKQPTHVDWWPYPSVERTKAIQKVAQP